MTRVSTIVRIAAIGCGLALPANAAEGQQDSNPAAERWRDELIARAEQKQAPACSGTACETDYKYVVPCASLRSGIERLRTQSESRKDDIFLMDYTVESVDVRLNDFRTIRGFEYNTVVSVYSIIDDTGFAFEILQPGGLFDEEGGLDAICGNPSLAGVGHHYISLLREEDGFLIIDSENAMVDVTLLYSKECSSEAVELERGM